MTYPPPPPGDPHEAPTTLDPYGHGPGGYAGPPSSAPASPPGYSPGYPAGHGAPPGYQQPGYQDAGYQQPGYQQPGYQQPGYQQPGYQQAGYQQAGYQQAGYQQAGYQQPGYQQPGYHQPGMPPPKRANTGLIVGGVAGGLVLLLVLAVGAVVLVRNASSDDPPVAQPPPGSEPLAPPPALDVPEEEPPGGGGTGTYRMVSDLCQTVDFTPIFDVVPSPDDPADWTGLETGDDGSYGWYSTCSIDLSEGSALGGIFVHVMINDDPARTRTDYEGLTGTLVSEPDTIEELNTPWQEGQLWLGDNLADEAAKVIAMDNNMAFSVEAYLFSAPDTQDALRIGVLAVAENIMEVNAQ